MTVILDHLMKYEHAFALAEPLHLALVLELPIQEKLTVSFLDLPVPLFLPLAVNQ